MTTLLPINASSLELAIDNAIAKQINMIDAKRIYEQWHPFYCPKNCLGWLAWAISVDNWDNDWSIRQKRNAIAQSVSIHQYKGTLQSLKAILNQQSLYYTIHEQACYTIHIRLFVTPTSDKRLTSPTHLSQLTRHIYNVIPARTHISVLLAVGFEMNIGIAGRIHAALHRHIRFSDEL